MVSWWDGFFFFNLIWDLGSGSLLSRSTFQRFNLVCRQFYAIESSFLEIFWVRSCFLAVFWIQGLDITARQLCRREEILFQCRKSSFIYSTEVDQNNWWGLLKVQRLMRCFGDDKFAHCVIYSFESLPSDDTHWNIKLIRIVQINDWWEVLEMMIKIFF